MNSRFRFIMALAMASIGLSGCALVWLGAGAAGGYAISADTVRNQFELPKARVFAHASAVARQLGMVTMEDAARGLIQLQVGETHVTITVKPLTTRTVELQVKARNQFFLPRVSVAQDVYTHILERLR